MSCFLAINHGCCHAVIDPFHHVHKILFVGKLRVAVPAALDGTNQRATTGLRVPCTMRGQPFSEPSIVTCHGASALYLIQNTYMYIVHCTWQLLSIDYSGESWQVCLFQVKVQRDQPCVHFGLGLHSHCVLCRSTMDMSLYWYIVDYSGSRASAACLFDWVPRGALAAVTCAGLWSSQTSAQMLHHGHSSSSYVPALIFMLPWLTPLLLQSDQSSDSPRAKGQLSEPRGEGNKQ